jgi:hypothetical protein
MKTMVLPFLTLSLPAVQSLPAGMDPRGESIGPAQIMADGPRDGLAQKTKWGAVTIPKLELMDVSLGEALKALTILSTDASNGKVNPNFLVTAPKAEKIRINLSLIDVPLTEAIYYLEELSGTRAVFAANAVVFLDKAE